MPAINLNDGLLTFNDENEQFLFQLDLVDAYYLFRSWNTQAIQAHCKDLDPNSAEYAEASEVARQAYLNRVKDYISDLAKSPLRLGQADTVDEAVRETYFAKKNSHNKRIVDTLK